MVPAVNKPQLTTAHPVELLAVTTARVGGEPKVLLSVRLDSEGFEATNLALSPQQTRRLLDDLTERFRASKLLKEFSSTEDDGRRAFERIMLDAPSATSTENEASP